ncbi:hypothetical protein D9619_012218 [Psilocybe cf. subviscida]|uniref:Uncharacterized protein n=1 Tax=Psilocybe cf. subviscida TaxID=2480587 RepID=A0A8H5B7E0_9AGAR|nr:hypothetical protein D9619_012218 [Psilocybe cf. subviscida]
MWMTLDYEPNEGFGLSSIEKLNIESPHYRCFFKRDTSTPHEPPSTVYPSGGIVVIIVHNIKTLLKKLKIRILGTTSGSRSNASVIRDIGRCNNADLSVNHNTSKTLEEVDRHDRDDGLLTLAKANALTLLHLANDIGPAHGYSGLGWQDLFAERTEWRKAR